MARIREYAEMSKAVYEADARLKDARMAAWERIGFKATGSDLTEALQAAAYRKGHEVVVAFKGTSQGRDAVADIKLGVGMNTYQYAEALDFLRTVRLNAGDKVTLCGHSLGGAIAQTVGNRARLLFATFNAPGVAVMSRNAGEMAATALTGTASLRVAGTVASALWHPVQAAQDTVAMFHKTRGVNFRLGKDVVGSIGVHFGRVIEIAYSGGALDVLQKHGIVTMHAAILNSQYGEQEIESLAG